MQTQGLSLFTTTEAAFLTRVPLKAVNNAIDKKTIVTHARRTQKDRSVRLVSEPALVYLSLERALVSDTTPSFRRKLFKAITTAFAKGASSVAVGALTLDLGPSWLEVMHRIKELRRAEQLAGTNAEVLGGAPFFRGTRISIHMIAELLSQGETVKSLRKGYPRLTDEMIRLAPIYAGAHPLRGRPRRRPWRGRPNSRIVRVRMRNAAAS